MYMLEILRGQDKVVTTRLSFAALLASKRRPAISSLPFPHLAIVKSYPDHLIHLRKKRGVPDSQ